MDNEQYQQNSLALPNAHPSDIFWFENGLFINRNLVGSALDVAKYFSFHSRLNFKMNKILILPLLLIDTNDAYHIYLGNAQTEWWWLWRHCHKHDFLESDGGLF